MIPIIVMARFRFLGAMRFNIISLMKMNSKSLVRWNTMNYKINLLLPLFIPNAKSILEGHIGIKCYIKLLWTTTLVLCGWLQYYNCYRWETGGITYYNMRNILDFIAVIEACGLMDIGFSRLKFTWSNKKGINHRIWKRLDKALVNYSWLELKPQTTITYVAATCSDHCLLFMEMVSNETEYQVFQIP